MSIIGSILSQACCCAAPVGTATGRIMSKFGLITECNVGISPQAGDELGCAMQACGWEQATVCSNGSKIGTKAYSRTPIVLSYKLESSEAFSGSGHQPAHWIWWTKNRCLELDPFFPGCNACCCQDGTFYAGFFASTPAPFPYLGDTLQNCGHEDAGGRCIDGAFAEDQSACYLDDYGTGGEADREFLVGAYDFFYRHYSGQPRSLPLYWWQWNSIYPSATLDEQYEAHSEFSSVCNTGPFNRDNQGLSTYQVRVAKYRSPDVWEILNFNDGKAIGVMRNNPSAVAQRGRVSYYEQCEYIDASNRPGIAPPYVNSPSQWDARGGHGLFRYFFGFASEEFSYVKQPTPSTQFLTKNNGVNDVLLGKALPSYFHQIADAVPLFSFATEFVQCTGAAGEGEQNLGYAMCEIGAELAQGAYTARQQTATQPNATDLDGWEDQCDAVDSALRQSEMEDMLACKDWREEIWDDLQTLEVFRQNYALGWSDMTSITAAFPTIQTLKPVGPVRLRGDWFDLRDLTVTSSGVSVNTSTRPPALARCQSDSTGVGSEYEDSTDSDKKTLQVEKQIYTMSAPPSDFYRTAASASTIVAGNQYKIATVGTTDFTLVGASTNGVGVIFIATASGPPGTGTAQLFDEDAYYAWQRLTQSVYFRSKPIGWDFNAMFQNYVPIGKTARYRWLENRRDAQYSTDIVTGGTALVSLGTNSSPDEGQPQWCTNGTPQDADLFTATVPCTSVDCDSHGAVVAYEYNSAILVARFCKTKFFNGEIETVCAGVSDPTAVTNGCCKMTRMSDAGDALVDNPTYQDGTKPSDSNICFARFINRPWEWYDGAVPYRMVPTSSNTVDRAAICCEFPHPYDAVCNTNTSMSIPGQRTDDAAAGSGQTPPNQTPCESDPCVQISAGQSHCYTSGPCANLDLSGAYGIGNYFCGSLSRYNFVSPTKGIRYKVGFTGDATAIPSTWSEKAPCSEEYPFTAFPVDPLPGRRFRYPVGHTDQNAIAASFVVQEYPGSADFSIQSSECCSIDDRDDQRRGTEGIQSRHWLSFPPLTITTGP